MTDPPGRSRTIIEIPLRKELRERGLVQRSLKKKGISVRGPGSVA